MPLNDQLTDEIWRRYQYCRDRGHLAFVEKADKCDKFVVGDQWLQEDLDSLELQQRPALTINKLLATLSNVEGEQIQNRTEVIFRPSAGSPPEVGEALSKVWMQIAQNNQLPWVRSDVFADGLVRSRGFYDVRMDYTDNIFGEVRIVPVNSKNVVIDPDGEEYDPDKWGDVFVTKWYDPDTIAVLFNKEDAEELRMKQGVTRYGYDSIDKFRDSFAGRYQNTIYTNGLPNENRRNIRVLDRQYRKLDKQKHFIDTVNGDLRPVPEGWDRNRIAAFLERMGGQINVISKMVKRIRWTVTADNLVLHDEWSPYKHFTIVPYFPHFRYGRTTGLVENLIGPQEILNKVSSQELHIVNTTANSGYIVEEDSLANMTPEELELNGAQTGIVIEYRKGAQPPVKIQPNQPPSGLDRISMKAEEHIKTISGISDSMMGFDRADVAAKAIAYKQQRGSISLAKVMDNLERTDWILARNTLDLIQEFYTNERILNITHDNFSQDQEQVAVNQVDPVTGEITNDLTLGEYNIVITSSPYRASLEDSQFEQAKALREIGVAIPDSVLIENSRLLRRSEIVKMLSQQAASPEAQQQQQLNLAMQQAEVQKKQSEVVKNNATAEYTLAKAQSEGMPEPGKEDNSIDPHVEKGIDIGHERYKIDKQMELEKYKHDRELEFKREQMAQQAEQARVEGLRQQALQEQQAAQQPQ